MKKNREIRKQVKKARKELKKEIPLAGRCPQCEGSSAGYVMGVPFKCGGCKGRGR